MSEFTCEKCLYWEKYTYQPGGTCHRFPPVLKPEWRCPTHIFPTTYADMWCGEFEGEPEEEEDDAELSEYKDELLHKINLQNIPEEL